MDMKIIYFVRHGESEANANPLPESKTVLVEKEIENSLTEKGLEQSKAVAERFKNIKIEKLIETSKIRSKQTAEAISAVANIPVTENDLFIEREGRFEAMFEHKHLPIPELTEVMKKKLNKPEWNYSEQELFETLIKRIEKAVKYLEGLPEENIAVVTHEGFLKLLIAYLIFKDLLTEEQAVLFIKGTGITNTGITVCKFNPELKHWKLITFNDQSHLG